MRVAAIIPARMASTRFPGKPLAKIQGLSMIEHVRRRVALSLVFDEVLVATCDREILEEVEQHGGRAVMTADTHERCTDRVAEAAAHIEADVVINVQGDEPFVRPEMLEAMIVPLREEADLQVTNLMTRIVNDEDFESENVVKAVCDPDGNALYFSREPIPSRRKALDGAFLKYRQLGIYAFRTDFLQVFLNLPATPLEIVESVDMLRIVEHGWKLRMVETPYEVVGVDTPEDLARAEVLMQDDPLYPLYAGEKGSGQA
ncbi:3-deoxy-manno-octulosonate cytidylyltransferase [Verrucomicrobiota bacterium]